MHIEGYPFEYVYNGEDVVILAGDIHTRNRLDQLLDQIPPGVQILFVAGNHEYYHMVFEEVKAYFRSLEQRYTNFRFLDNEQFDLFGIPVYGGTMFTDFQLGGFDVVASKVAEHFAKDGINDFRLIKRKVEDVIRLWTVEDHKVEHQKFVDGLKSFLRHTEGSKFRIVISHFMPSMKCIAPQFKGNALNPYFTVDMEPFMGWDGLWVAGHGHNHVDVDIDGTRLVMNPRGYRSSTTVENPNFIDDFIIEVDAK